MSANQGRGGSPALAFVLVSATMIGVLWFAAGQPTLEQLVGDGETSAVETPTVETPAVETPAVEPVATWDCFWQPLINDDWHDDVLCVRGFESQRPFLLGEQPHVTEAEMTDAGEAYEAQLNG